MKTDLFSTVATAEFSKFAGILSEALSQHHLLGFEIASIWMPLPPLALLVVILPEAHLTSHSRIFGSRWVITPLWLSGSWVSFLYSSSVYSCHLFLIFCFCWVHTISVLYRAHLCMKCSVISDFLVFTILLFSSISLHWSLRKAFLSLLIILWSSAFRWVYLSFSPFPFFSQPFVRTPQTAILLFCISFSWRWSWSLSPVQCHEPPSIVLQIIRSSPLNLFLTSTI